MSEHTGEKTEQPTQRRIEDAFKRGQFAQSAEVQTAFVLLGGTLALMLFGRQSWQQMTAVFGSVLGHLHVISVSPEVMRGQLIRGLLVLGACAAPAASMRALPFAAFMMTWAVVISLISAREAASQQRQAMVKMMVLAIPLLDGVFVGTLTTPWQGLAIAAFALPAWLTARRLYVT